MNDIITTLLEIITVILLEVESRKESLVCCAEWRWNVTKTGGAAVLESDETGGDEDSEEDIESGKWR